VVVATGNTHPTANFTNTSHRAGVGAMGSNYLARFQLDIGKKTLVTLD
jgi:hypothetical protein